MNIILLEKIKKLGDIGDEVKVKSGYARNFLVPNKKALYATSENRQYFEEKKTDIQSQNDKLIKDAKEKLKKISGQEVVLIRAASDSGQLFGSVSTKDLVNSLAEKNISILKNEIDLNKSIKNLTYENVTINLHPEVSCEIILNVARSFEEASTQKKLGKAVTSNSETEDNKSETSKELSVQDEVKTDEKPKKINQEVHLINEDDISKETEASTEKNITLDSDTAGK
jgi:large subunit ribosomal protein L9